MVLLALIAPAYATTQSDRLWKQASGKAAGDTNMPVELESIPSSLDIHASAIFGETISTNPASAVATGVAVYVSIPLTLDRKYGGNRVWVALPAWTNNFNSAVISTSVMNTFISPMYGGAYSAVVEGHAGRVFSASDNGWYFDYRAGMLVFDRDQTNMSGAVYATNASYKLSAYSYTGRMVSAAIAGGDALLVPGGGGVITNFDDAELGMTIKYSGDRKFRMEFSSINTIVTEDSRYGVVVDTPVDELEFAAGDNITLQRERSGVGDRRTTLTINSTGGGGGGGDIFTDPNTMVYADPVEDVQNITINHSSVLATDTGDVNVPPVFVGYSTLADRMQSALNTYYVRTGEEQDDVFINWLDDAATYPGVTLNNTVMYELVIPAARYDGFGDNIQTGRIILANQAITNWGDVGLYLGDIGDNIDQLTVNLGGTITFLSADALSPGRVMRQAPSVQFNGIEYYAPGATDNKLNVLYKNISQNDNNTFYTRFIKSGSGIKVDYDELPGGGADLNTIKISAIGAEDWGPIWEDTQRLYWRNGSPTPGSPAGWSSLPLDHGGNPEDDTFLAIRSQGTISAVKLQDYITAEFVFENASSLYARQVDIPEEMGSFKLPSASYPGSYYLQAKNHIGQNAYNGASVITIVTNGIPYPKEWHSIRFGSGFSGDIDDDGVLTIYYPGSIPAGNPSAGYAVRNSDNIFTATNTFSSPIILGATSGESPLRSLYGNARGAYAVDLQTDRNPSLWSPADVASGNHSFLGPAESSRADGGYTFVGTGYRSRASGSFGFLGATYGGVVEGSYGAIGSGYFPAIAAGASHSFIGSGDYPSIGASFSFIGTGAGVSIALGASGGAIMAAQNASVQGTRGAIIAGQNIVVNSYGLAHGANLYTYGLHNIAIGRDIRIGSQYSDINLTAYSGGIGPSITITNQASFIVNMNPSITVSSMAPNTILLYGGANAAVGINLVGRAPKQVLDVAGGIVVGAASTHYPGTIRFNENDGTFQFGTTNGQWIILSSAGLGESGSSFSGFASDLVVVNAPDNYTVADDNAEEHLIGINDALGELTAFRGYTVDETSRSRKFLYADSDTDALSYRKAMSVVTVNTTNNSVLLSSDSSDGILLVPGSNMLFGAATVTDGPTNLMRVTMHASGIPGEKGAELAVKGEWVVNRIPAYESSDLVTFEGSTYYAPGAVVGNIAPSNPASAWALFVSKGPTGPQGARGLDGNTGPAGATGPAGSPGIGLTFRNNWDAGTPYTSSQLVAFAGTTYYASQNSTNRTPTNNPTYWSVFAAKGDKGDQGDTGSQGPQGLPGAQLVTRNEWTNTIPYNPGDLVQWEGQSWYAVSPASSGQEPGVVASWRIFAARGEDGEAGDAGPIGPQGEPGIGGVVRGTWTNTATYYASNIVSYGGSAWVASNNVVSALPPGIGSEWTLLVAKGDTGLQGPAGVGLTGAQGPAGNPGVNARYAGAYSVDRSSYTTSDIVRFSDALYIPTNFIDQVGSPKYPTNPASGWTIFLEDGYTPVKGVDYDDGYTPIKGIDYSDGVGLTYYLEWDEGYNVGGDYGYSRSNLVTYQGSTFYSIVDDNEDTPDNASAWRLFLSKGANGAALIPYGTWTSTVTYAAYSLVYLTNNAGTYYSVSNSLNKRPDLFPSIWTVFSNPTFPSDPVSYDRIRAAMAFVTTNDLSGIPWSTMGGGGGNISFSNQWSMLFSGSNSQKLERAIGADGYVLSSQAGTNIVWIPPFDPSNYITYEGIQSRLVDFTNATAMRVPTNMLYANSPATKAFVEASVLQGSASNAVSKVVFDYGATNTGINVLRFIGAAANSVEEDGSTKVQVVNVTPVIGPDLLALDDVGVITLQESSSGSMGYIDVLDALRIGGSSTNIVLATNGNLSANGRVSFPSGDVTLGTNRLLVGGVSYASASMFDAYASSNAPSTNIPTAYQQINWEMVGAIPSATPGMVKTVWVDYTSSNVWYAISTLKTQILQVLE